jgi:hypothetical protein
MVARGMRGWGGEKRAQSPAFAKAQGIGGHGSDCASETGGRRGIPRPKASGQAFFCVPTSPRDADRKTQSVGRSLPPSRPGRGSQKSLVAKAQGFGGHRSDCATETGGRRGIPRPKASGQAFFCVPTCPRDADRKTQNVGRSLPPSRPGRDSQKSLVANAQGFGGQAE